MAKHSYKTNILYNSIYRCVVILTPLITSPYLARVLGAEKLGIYSYANAFATYFVIFSLLGVNDYGNRTIAQARGDRNALSDRFWQIYYLQLFLTVILLAAYLITIFVAAKYFTVQLVFAIYVFSSALEVNWFAFGLEEFKLTSIRSIITRLGIVAGIFLFVRSENDLWKYALITTLGNVISLIIILPLVKKYTDFRKPELKKILSHVKPNLILFLPVIATSVYQQLSKLMLSAWSTEAEVGFFQNAENIVTLPTFITTAIVTVMLPYASNLVASGEHDKNRMMLHSFLKYTSILNLAMSFGMLAIAKDFIPWYLGSAFERSAELLMIMAPMIFLSGCGSILRYQYLIPNEYDRANLISMFAGAGVDILLNLLFIGKFGAAGSAVAVVAAYFVTLVIQLLYAKRELDLRAMLLELLPYAGFGAVMFGAVRAVSSLPIPTLLRILAELAAGGVIFVACSALWMKHTGDPILANFAEALCGRLRKRK